MACLELEGVERCCSTRGSGGRVWLERSCDTRLKISRLCSASPASGLCFCLLPNFRLCLDLVHGWKSHVPNLSRENHRSRIRQSLVTRFSSLSFVQNRLSGAATRCTGTQLYD